MQLGLNKQLQPHEIKSYKHKIKKVKGQLAGGGGVLWRPPAQLV